ncbi:MAG: hypothetical protein L6Q95_05115 [Planctomycetes bacterium]|nr:hypothetical protein [Planctomycetota bacterium]
MYRALDPGKLIETLGRLQTRIDERFPAAGLGRVCAELTETARTSAAEAARLAKPSWPWRIAVGAMVVLGVWAQVAAAKFLHLERVKADVDLLQVLEAAVNLLLLFGGAVWFLLSVEKRRKRERALDALHSLRALAHVIDMHQLTKDPTAVLKAHEPTAGSPVRAMSRFELTRYLDYCAEMLALIGKLAALYADEMRDSVVIDAVNEMEDLTTGLAQKMWQKIMLIDAAKEAGA